MKEIKDVSDCKICCANWSEALILSKYPYDPEQSTDSELQQHSSQKKILKYTEKQKKDFKF